ncbi:MAG: hypothetical protein A3F18_07255 [Legionellales bacterium RIFCSPHIGHO2_12_FULL_37_14]|nr:MAG: hypothetical protein A3F18_07255 [Legionellales bacterium RIFCSPHIGHO2_12_FULL_37_14]
MTLSERDLKHIWHPCARMQDFAKYPPLHILSAKGALLNTPYGEIIDAIGSWWCKPLGHRPEVVISAIQDQLQSFEHVITAQTTNNKMVELGEKLAGLSKLPYTFFSSDGSSAVEVALKLTLHARKIEGYKEKTSFLALNNGYHGETLATLSVSDLGDFKEPYKSHCFTSNYVKVPYTKGMNDASSLNAKREFFAVLPYLETIKPTLNALIFEPIVQGAAGMRTYSVDFLNQLLKWAKNNKIYCIADEIMTGLCRTGNWFATDYLTEKPDIMCIAKGLTAGTLPLSCTLISQELFDIFYFAKQHAPFLHSHTHSGNALAISAALATLNYMETIDLNTKATILQQKLHQAFKQISAQTKALTNIRGIGGIIAGCLSFSDHEHLQRFTNIAQKRGALLRPIGNSLYWFPPINIEEYQLAKLTDITYESIKESLL